MVQDQVWDPCSSQFQSRLHYVAFEDPIADGSQTIVSKWNEKGRGLTLIIGFHRCLCTPRIESHNQHRFEKGVLR
jgi:hypothetical protein